MQARHGGGSIDGWTRHPRWPRRHAPSVVLAAIAVAAAALAAPALADEGNENFRSELRSVDPEIEGLEVAVVDGDDALELTNTTGKLILFPATTRSPGRHVVRAGAPRTIRAPTCWRSSRSSSAGWASWQASPPSRRAAGHGPPDAAPGRAGAARPSPSAREPRYGAAMRATALERYVHHAAAVR